MDIKSKVNFLVIGAQKCATSWVYYCLRDHPEIRVPPVKREDTYLGGKLHKTHGTEWYLNHLEVKDTDEVIGDVSVDYLFDPRSPAVVKDTLPQARLIAFLRDPIDRAISSYYWNLRRGNINELNLNRGMHRVLEVASEAESLSSYDPSATAVNILARGIYDVQIQRYLQYFDTSQILLIPYDAVERDQELVLQEMYRFVGVDESFRPRRLTQTRRPKQNAYLKPLLALERDLPNSFLFNRLIDYANQVVGYFDLQRKRPDLSQSVYEDLRDFYGIHVRMLFSLLDRFPTGIGLWKGVRWLEDGLEEGVSVDQCLK